MKSNEIQRKLLTALTCILACALPIHAASIIYVDPNAPGTNNGSTWANAYNYLQDALADANSSPKPVEIRVARGKYHPDKSTANPNGGPGSNATFQLINGVTIKGGYAGYTHADPNARDIGLSESILSGDIQENDTSYPQRDNSKRVVDGSHTDRTAVLDGFTITRGYLRTFDRVPPDFDPGWTARATGGMRNISGSPTIVNCTFRENRCAVFSALGSNPYFTGCKFEQNCVHQFDLVSAMINIESHPEITACVFEEDCDPASRAIYNLDSDVLLTGCRFSNNKGGAISSKGGQLTLIACHFTGGAVGVRDGTAVIVEDCVFRANEVLGGSSCLYAKAEHIAVSRSIFQSNSTMLFNGGVIGLSGNGSAIITDCIFEGNTANGRGGVAVYSSTESLTLAECVFAGNQTRDDGNIISQGGGTLEMVNCTLAQNRMAQGGCIAILGYTKAVSTVTNSIFWDDNPFEILNEEHLVVEFSNVRDGWLGEGNIDTDPLFSNPGYWDPNGTPEDPNDDSWVSGDYHLKSQAGRWDPASNSWVQDDVTSPCIDAGDPMTTIGHEPFPNGGIINMGAYGGTTEASKSYFNAPTCETITAGDINGDCLVDFKDFHLLTLHWLEQH